MSGPTEVEVLQQALAESRGYADQQQRAATHWRQAHQRVAEALGFVDAAGASEQAVLDTLKAVAAPTPYATLRDQFAVASLTGLLASGSGTIDSVAQVAAEQGKTRPQVWAEFSYLLADAMLGARK